MRTALLRREWNDSDFARRLSRSTGVVACGKDLPRRPLARHTGRGHFAALEQPDRFLADLRAFIAAVLNEARLEEGTVRGPTCGGKGHAERVG